MRIEPIRMSPEQWQQLQNAAENGVTATGGNKGAGTAQYSAVGMPQQGAAPAQGPGKVAAGKGQPKVIGGGGSAGRALNNKLVPEDQRLGALEEIFDEKTLKRMGIIECATCASRTYQDGSDDPGVSFKAPTNLSPAQAATAVISHEMEHVTNEQAHAEQEGREVLNQSVQIFHDVCPECGVGYVSGGVTKTTTAAKNENPYSAVNPAVAEGNLVDVEL